MNANELARFEAKVEPEPNSGCWIWVGSRCGHGYGYLWVLALGRTTKAATLAYEHFVGPVPAGYELDHLCRVRCCVNPAHLEPVTHRINMLRGNTPAAAHAAKTACPNGHPYDAVDYRGRRFCRRCRSERQRERYHQRRTTAFA